MEDSVFQSRMAKLEVAEAQRTRALIDGDWALMETLADEALVVTHSNGRRETREAFLLAGRSGAVKYLSMDHDDRTTTLRQDHAVVSSQMRARIAVPGGIQLDLVTLSTVVWSLRNGEWKMLAVHTTPKAAATNAAATSQSASINRE
jgi:Domain of unknown function (DUF4440)